MSEKALEMEAAAAAPAPAEAAQARLAYEDVLRGRDRLRIREIRAARRPLRLLWLLAGPGVLVMLGENDGPSMVSYATTGATYGIGFFVPFILLTFVMAFVVQEMTVRLGVATHRGHSELIFQRFGPFWGYFAMGDLVFGNLLTLVTEFIAIQAGGLYFGLPPWLSVAIGVALVLGSLAFRRYATWERALMGLAAFNLLFVPAALLAHPDGAALVHALATWGPLPGGMGTGVSDPGARQCRRDRHALDDLLPAERCRRQGPDPRRSPAGADGHRDRRRARRRRRDRDGGRDRAVVRRPCRRLAIRERRRFRDRAAGR